MSIKNKEEELIKEFEKTRAGMKRNFTQIADTFTFEIKKNFKTFIIMLIFFMIIFTLFSIVLYLQEIQEVPLPDDPIDYLTTYLSMIGFLIILSTSGFAGSIIAEDFQKQTGNLLFPKISKIRLFIGRIMSRYLLNAVCIIVYYTLVSTITFIKYEEFPPIILTSLGWALFYTLSMFAFVTFLSSLMKSTSATIITSIIFYLMVFSLILQMMAFFAGGQEPFFLITYYENIITAIFNMPDPRYRELTFGGPRMGGGPEITFTQWITPDELTAFIGMLLYAVILLTLAYLRYRTRQSKSEV